MPCSSADRCRSNAAKLTVTATAPTADQATRGNVSQPPELIAAATHTPAVTAIAPTGSAPRYGLPTMTTPSPPKSTTTTGRHVLPTHWARQPAASSSAAMKTPRPTLPRPA